MEAFSIQKPFRSTLCILLWVGLLLSHNPARAGQSDGPFVLYPARDIAILGSGLLTGTAVYLFHTPPSPLSRQETEQLNPSDISIFDRSATHNWSPFANQLSEAAAVLSFSAMAPLAFSEKASRDALVLGVMTAQLFTWSVTLPQLAKITSLRNRPYMYNTEVALHEKQTSRGRESFFSRTTTVAFAGAVFSSTLYDAYFPDSPFTPWVWGGTLAMAGTAAYLKYHSGQHFPSDILAGAAAGAFIGWFIPHLHKNKKPKHNGFSFMIVPTAGGMQAAIYF